MKLWTRLAAMIVAAGRRLRDRLFGPPQVTIRQVLVWHFGRDYELLETHDKSFPGYDIASIHGALASFHEEACTEVRQLGACGALTIRGLFDLLRQPHLRNLQPSVPTYERVPVNVEEESSFATNSLSLAVMRPEAGQRRGRQKAAPPSPNGPPDEDTTSPERICFLLAVTHFSHDAYGEMDMRTVPRQSITISIACRSREVADRFFGEIEERRQRLSIFRGKVIDPIVYPGGIQTIGFRAIQKVRAEDLILPASVKALIHNAILGFYEHREVLEELGIEMKRGILFHSPPGTGKTSISLYLAGLLPKFTVCFVSGERLLYPREICRMARYLQPSLIVFEDIDLVAQERNANGLATVLGELMNQIDGCEPTEQVLFVMTTNSLDRLEHAVKNRPGRIDQIIEIPLPDADERRQLLKHFARNLRLDIDDMDRILEATEGATPAMLKEIVKRAAVSAVERNGGKDRAAALAIQENDLLLATEQVRALRDPEAVPGTFGFRERKR